MRTYYMIVGHANAILCATNMLMFVQYMMWQFIAFAAITASCSYICHLMLNNVSRWRKTRSGPSRWHPRAVSRDDNKLALVGARSVSWVWEKLLALISFLAVLTNGDWRSLVAHRIWDAGVVGSNPTSPTNLLYGEKNEWIQNHFN